MFYFLLIGAIAGWLAGRFMRGRGFGIAVNMLVGIAGSFIGGFLFTGAGLRPVGLVGALVTSTVGAVVFLYSLQWLGISSSKSR